MELIKKIKKYSRSSFIEDLTKIITGTIIGRIITFGSIPILTRIYTPSEFSILAAYMSVVTLLSLIAAGRYEIAIPSAENEEESTALVIIAVTLATTLTIIIIAIMTVAAHYDTQAVKSLNLQYYNIPITLIPFGILLLTTFNTLQFWATRNRYFGKIGKIRATQALTGNVVSICLGAVGFKSFGLIIGQILCNGAGAIQLANAFILENKRRISEIQWKTIKRTAKKYKNYPLYSSSDALLNAGGIHIPILIIASTGNSDAGNLYVILQILSAPMTLIGGSISQVYLSRTREAIKEKRLKTLTFKTLIILTFFSIITISLLSALITNYHEKIFGKNWSQASEYVILLAPWVIIQFIASPISMVMHTTNNQKKMLYLTLAGFLIRLSSVLAVGTSDENFSIISALAYSSCLYYLVCLATFIKISINADKKYVQIELHIKENSK